jgi:ATP-dependent Clp protease protease subunit
MANKKLGESVVSTENIMGIDAKSIIDLGLLKHHTHLLTGSINEETIDEAMRWLIYENMNTNDSKKILTLYINSIGGNLTDAFGLIDVIKNSKFIVRTIGVGSVISAAFLIFASGNKGQRHIAKNASIMCHQFTESFDNKYHDVKAALKETENCNKRMIDILTEATGLSPNKVKSKLLPPTDVYLTAQELIEYGVADHIL